MSVVFLKGLEISFIHMEALSIDGLWYTNV